MDFPLRNLNFLIPILLYVVETLMSRWEMKAVSREIEESCIVDVTKVGRQRLTLSSTLVESETLRLNGKGEVE